MTTIRAASLFLLILLVAASVHAKGNETASGWQVLTAPVGHFQVQMPGSPVRKHFDKKSFVGVIRSDVFTVKTGAGEEFSVEWVRIPSAALFFVGQKSILNRSRKALLKNERGEEVGFSEIPFESGMVQELTYRAKKKDGTPLLGVARFTLVKKDLYILSVSAPPEIMDMGRFEKFVRSFKILPGEGEP